MAAPKTKSAADRAARLETVSRLYLQLHRPSEIALTVGVSRQQISYDLKTIRKLWMKSAIRDFDAAKAEELARLDALEACYWPAWHNSKGTKSQTTVSTIGEGKDKRDKITKRTEDSAGDPRFLDGVLKCIDKRCRLLGLDAPIRNELTGKGGGPLPPVGIRIVYADP